MAITLVFIFLIHTFNCMFSIPINHIETELEPQVIGYSILTKNKTESLFPAIKVTEVLPYKNDQVLRKTDESTINKLPAGSWQIVDDLKLSAVVSANQKFGYIVHKPQFKRFRYEERSRDGLIHGEFGIISSSGNVRGVCYTADDNINPVFVYKTLLKFIAL